MVQRTTSSSMRRKMPSQRCGRIGGTGLLLLFLLMVCRVPGVVICCYKTFDCAKTFHHSFFHCNDSDSNSTPITYTFAVKFELVTVSVLEICRFIFLIFCGKLLLPKWKKLMKEPCRICQIKKLLLPRTLIFLGAFCASVVRFGAFITYDDLGGMPKAARAIFVLYITDFFLMFVIVIILNYIKIQDLSDCIGYSPCCKLKHKQRAERVNLTWVILKAVILLWCLEYFVYLVLAVFRMTFDVSEVTEKRIDGKSNRHEIVMVLVQFGQIGFTGFVTECLLFKFCDDGEPILGSRTDENERDAWCGFFKGEGTPDERTELLRSGSLPSVYTTCEEYLP